VAFYPRFCCAISYPAHDFFTDDKDVGDENDDSSDENDDSSDDNGDEDGDVMMLTNI